MQKPRQHWKRRRLPPRRGADAAFAKAMARAEFGKNYTDEAREAEVRRSLARGKARQARERAPGRSAEAEPHGIAPADTSTLSTPPVGPKKFVPWQPPRLREQRQRLAEARARLLELKDEEPAT